MSLADGSSSNPYPSYLVDGTPTKLRTYGVLEFDLYAATHWWTKERQKTVQFSRRAASGLTTSVSSGSRHCRWRSTLRSAMLISQPGPCGARRRRYQENKATVLELT